MNIGILTEVNDCNYGALLQAFALVHVLGDMGHNAQQIDFWYKPNNKALWGNFAKSDSPLGWGWRFIQLARRLKSVRAAQHWALRSLRSKAFIDTFIPLSSQTYRTAEALKALPPFDALIVGSDQVWNPDHFASPNPFLLSSIHSAQKKIAYAASIGRTNIPEDRIPEYKEAFASFSAISLREQANLEQVRKLASCPVTAVVDPSLLLSSDQWKQLLHLRMPRQKYDICVYWLGELEPLLKVVDFIVGQNKTVAVFTEPSFLRRRTQDGRTALESLTGDKVCYLPDADPRAFLEVLNAAEEVVSDSFHALMFSVIFRKRCQILLNTSPARREMSVRLSDFSKAYLESSPIVESPDAYIRGNKTVSPLQPTAALDRAKAESLTWLRNSL